MKMFRNSLFAICTIFLSVGPSACATSIDPQIGSSQSELGAPVSTEIPLEEVEPELQKTILEDTGDDLQPITCRAGGGCANCCTDSGYCCASCNGGPIYCA